MTGELDLRAVMAEVARLSTAYCVSKVYSDKFGGNWPAQWLQEISSGTVVLAEPVLPRRDGSSTELYLHKSDAFLEIGPYFRTGALRLLDDEQLVREFRNLEVRPLQGGKVYIGRPKARNMTDDAANATALAAAMSLGRSTSGAETSSFTMSTTPAELKKTEAQREGFRDPLYADVEPDEAWDADKRMGTARASAWRAAWRNG